MRRQTMDDTPAGFGAATRAALRRSTGTRPRRWLIAVTLLLGVLAAVGLTTVIPADELTFAALAHPVQSLMSVAVPFLGTLLAHDLRRSPGTGRLAPTLLAAALLAAAVGLLGAVFCAAALALAPAGGAWQYAGTIVLGGVLVQVVACLVGVGLGLLLHSFAVAALASIVLPLGLYGLLGAVDAVAPARAWLTPYAAAQNLLAGDMNMIKWVQWVVVLLIWGVGLTAVGTARLRRQDTPAGSPAPAAVPDGSHH
jgi:hypothetical protein